MDYVKKTKGQNDALFTFILPTVEYVNDDESEGNITIINKTIHIEICSLFERDMMRKSITLT